MEGLGSFSVQLIEDKNVDRPDGFWKAQAIKDLCRVVKVAYAQGLTREEVQAICGAAYGDWYEANEKMNLPDSGVTLSILDSNTITESSFSRF